MPVLNEAESIAGVVTSWIEEMERLEIDYELLIYDDGSQDATVQMLNELMSCSARIVLKTHKNIGHGPTILRGYWEARGEWIFQVDSDGEVSSDQFKALWLQRGNYDVLIGYRMARDSSLVRRIITTVARLTVWALFGKGVRDVNTPFRLIRRKYLVRLLERVPMNMFAPNVVISGLAARDGLRIYECAVLHQGRKAGTSSIVKWKLWKAATRAFVQTLQVAIHNAGNRRRGAAVE